MKVRLISHTMNPLWAVCVAVRAMNQKNPVTNLTEKEQKKILDETLKTRLRGALEFASFEFCIEGVTRAFTHQLVRHRKMHFSQQSMRFFNASESGFRIPDVKDKHKSHIRFVKNKLLNEYDKLVKEGCPIQDARSLLPTNIETLICFGATYRDLLEMAEVRLCLQTQDEFREVMRGIKKCIEDVSPVLASYLVPVCKRTDVCEFKSIYDRPCVLQKTLRGGSKNESEKGGKNKKRGKSKKSKTKA